MKRTVGFYTDNSISQAVMNAFKRAGVETMHISEFEEQEVHTSIFYGLLRGTGRAIINCIHDEYDYYYLDNGYFDAVYMDRNKVKHMNGEYRLCKNCLIEPFTGAPVSEDARRPLNLLLLPPSPYAAFMYDTTPEDWLQEWTYKARRMGDTFSVRDKLDARPFREAVQEYDAVLAFNSIAAMEAIEAGKSVYTTHGIVRNAHLFGDTLQKYDHGELKAFYAPKQFTLEQIARGEVCL